MIARPAPAKVNLYLRIVGRRADGYHLLDSLIAFASLADQVAVDAAETLSLEIDGPFASALASAPAEDNLVLRAARALAAALGVTQGARLRLTKNVPVAAGLGGGSADAAAALRVLLALWRADLPEARLRAIASRLGADVPVCLAGRPATVSGVGDIIGPAPSLPSCGLLLVNSGVALPTPEVFQAATAQRGNGAFADPLPLERAPVTVQALAQALALRGNDLTEAAIGLVPDIAGVLARLRATPGCRFAAMSGSGATCFALYDDVPSAEHARLVVHDARPLWWSDAGALLSG